MRCRKYTPLNHQWEGDLVCGTYFAGVVAGPAALTLVEYILEKLVQES